MRKINKSELKSIIKEELVRFIKIDQLKEKKNQIEKILKENEEFSSEEQNEPDSENDCIISTNGWDYSLSCAGKFIGKYEDFTSALLNLKSWRKKHNYFPNIWFVSDHGNSWMIDENGNEIK